MNTEEFTLKCSLKTGTSQRGNEYTYLELNLDKDYKKRVFLENAELVILQKNVGNKMPFLDKLEK